MGSERPYYGWYVVAGCNAVAIATWGIGVFTPGVFVAHYAASNGWSTASLSVGATLFHLTAGVAGIGIGRALDRRGPRLVLLGGAAALAAGIAGLGAPRQLWHTYLAFVVLGMGFAGLHTMTLGKIIAMWFDRHRGRAMTIATLGASGGGMILVPFTARSLEHRGPTATGLVLAVLATVLVVPVAVTVIKNGPDTVGAEPDGRATTLPPPGPAPPTGSVDVRDLRQLMAHKAFWALATSLPVVMLAQGGFLFHQVLFLSSTSFSLIGAASVVTATTAAAIIGRLAFAVVGDRWAHVNTASAVFVTQAIAFAILVASSARPALIVGSTLFGLTMGIVVVLQPLTVAAAFGSTSFGHAYGPIYLLIRAGAAVGPLAVGAGATMVGSYPTTWAIISIALVIAAISIRRANSPAGATQREDAIL